MMAEILDHARLVRLLKSGQAALPVTASFWADWARGLAVDLDELAQDILMLEEAGVIAGARGEDNVAMLGTSEALVRPDQLTDPAIIRWRAQTGDGSEIVSANLLGMPEPPEGALCAVRWLKVGFQFDWVAEARGDSLLEPSRDRTPLLREIDEKVPTEKSREMQALWKAATTATALDPAEEPWEELARRCGQSAEEARKGLGQLIVQGYLRRFGLTVNPTRAGLQGLGMAQWDLEGEDAEGAGRALASTRGASEVCIRSDADGRTGLYAVLGGRTPDSGREMAENISRQWGRALAQWTELKISRMD